MARTERVSIQGNEVQNTSLRARLDPDAPGFSGTFTNFGPDIMEHSASADGGTPTTVAVMATSGALTTHRFLRSLGRSNILCTDCRVEGVVR